MSEVRVVTDVPTRSGESPVWDVDDGRLYWIDNAEGLIFRSAPDGRDVTVWRVPHRVTAIARRADGGLVVAGGRRLFHFDLDEGQPSELFRDEGATNTPFNDAKVEPPLLTLDRAAGRRETMTNDETAERRTSAGLNQATRAKTCSARYDAPLPSSICAL